jgi:RimJ/RimL family protein N-acetyltransferase
MTVVESERLALRRLRLEDAGFVLELLNQPSFLRFIGDKGVRNLDGARDYLRSGPLDSYERHGFGLYLVTEKDGGAAIGICGLLRREALDDVDVGFALLPRFWRRGYASEAAAAVLDYGRTTLGLERIVAVTQPDNLGSIKTLEKLGMRFERMVRLSEDDVELQLFATADGGGDRSAA